PPSAAAAAAGGATTAVAGSTPGTSTSTGTSTTSPSGGTGTAVVAPASGAEYKLTLVKIEKGAEGTKELTWSVDGVTKQTIGGMRFGKYGELIQLGVSGDSTFATIQVGDAMPINVKVGETVNVL
ncbi:MAG: hypothetical protein JWL64_31, partial [Frankiales bacterium]|nr:hypothetical protein [Frankiales bacterium]